jgi:hypothetical protein
MKKITFLLGLGTGFLLGSKVGHGPYQTIEHQVRGLANRQDVQDVVEATKESTHELVAEAVDAATTKLASANAAASR